MKISANSTSAVRRLRAHKFLIVSFCAAAALVLGTMNGGLHVGTPAEPRIGAPQGATTPANIPGSVSSPDETAAVVPTTAPLPDQPSTKRVLGTTVVPAVPPAAAPAPQPSMPAPDVPQPPQLPQPKLPETPPTGGLAASLGAVVGGITLAVGLEVELALLGRLL